MQWLPKYDSMMTNSEMGQGTQGRVRVICPIAPCGTSQAILEEPKVLAALRRQNPKAIQAYLDPTWWYNSIPGHMPMMAIMAKRPFATSAESFLVLNSMVDSVDSKFAQFAIKRNLPTHIRKSWVQGLERSCQSQWGQGQGCLCRSCLVKIALLSLPNSF